MLKTKTTLILIAGLIFFAGCKDDSNKDEADKKEENQLPFSVSEESFGKLADGSEAKLYTFSMPEVIEVKITNFGGIITRIHVPDKNGKMGDVTLGYDNLQGYLDKGSYFGALIGRYGNRIADASFSLDGETYSLAANNGKNHLHGGIVGLDKVLWNAESFNRTDGAGLILTYMSPDGEEGYPGNLQIKVTYTITPDGAIDIDYEATTDKPTIVNLTNHAYFNLKDAGASDILGHELILYADGYLPVDETLIPNDGVQPVEGTPMDFRTAETIGARIEEDFEQIELGLGYDHCWALNNSGNGLGHAASVYEPVSGRQMDVYTTEPGIQFYSGNFLDGSITGKDGNVYERRSAFCLETEHYPDSPNQPEFPSVVLNPGDTYQTSTRYKFSVR